MKILGIDTGGTFTDMVVLDQETGEVQQFKTPSTPKDPDLAVIICLEELFNRGVSPDEVTSFVHGTTLGTNLLIQGKGALVGILVTEGFSGISDVWQVPRFGADMYQIYVEKRPFVLPRYREEIREYVGEIPRDLEICRNEGFEEVMMYPSVNIQVFYVFRRECLT